MPGIYRHQMRQGQAAISQLHTVSYDLGRITQHALDLERTLYRITQSILLNRMIELDDETKLAGPHEEIRTAFEDYWTRAQLYAALTHAVELTGHICPSCEGQGGEHV